MLTQRSFVAAAMLLAVGAATAAQDTPKDQEDRLPAVQTPKAVTTLPAVQSPAAVPPQPLPGLTKPQSGAGKASGDGSVRQPIGGQTPTVPKVLPPGGPRAATPAPNQPLPAPAFKGLVAQRVVYKARLSTAYSGALGGWNCANGDCLRNTIGPMPDIPALFRACRELQQMARAQRIKNVLAFGVGDGPTLEGSPPCPE